jgi:hypothetical protein
MPTRLKREGINSSRAVAALDWGAEVFYRRMLLVVDDFGRCEVDYLDIRSKAYPVHVNVREADIIRWIAACQSVRPEMPLLVLYEVAGKQYLVLTKTEPPRAKISKYPNPPPELIKRFNLYADDNICKQMKANAPRASDSDSLSDSDFDKRLGKLFGRGEDDLWSHFEKSTLLDLKKRPTFATELDLLEAFKTKPESYFPQSLSRLLRDWTETVDRAKNYKSNRENNNKSRTQAAKSGGNF